MKLVNFEINRFSKIYLSLLLMTILSQFAAVIIKVQGFLNNADQTMLEEKLTEAAYIETFGGVNFNLVSGSLWFLGPIALCAVALIFYIFLIWYRDWFGKNTFIYRLLMLPTTRLSLYLSKATAIFLMVLGLIALQLIILPMENALFNSMMPEVYLTAKMSVMTITESKPVLALIMPSSFTQFIISYGIGLMIMFVLFTAILLERSYPIKGIVLGIVYCGLAGALLISPIMIDEFSKLSLYPSETFGSIFALGLVITGVSIWFGSWLLKKRVTV
ncbi:hypothetical protein ACQKL5_13410 [Peribacillus sp. NPDC097675]|uniref:hypothetical protein n=1 Tax=Peribacillus sp. NPDC097675 TaxID=3390618 RepID=UPI003CFE55DC